ncbi:MAG: hypothetical protein U5K54_10720 [Cytophagales bacterium]|nr:hypothetical protein [Cytophagales bacterium]
MNPTRMNARKRKEHLAADFSKNKVETLGQHILKNLICAFAKKHNSNWLLGGKDGLEIFRVKYLLQKENQLARVHAIWGISQFCT